MTIKLTLATATLCVASAIVAAQTQTPTPAPAPAPAPATLPDASKGLTAVEGLKVGHFTLSERPTGCTVVLASDGTTGGVDVRGGAPGTRETDLLNPVNLSLIHI